MPWEYSENMCEKWLRVKSGMNCTTRRIRTTMWKSKIVQVNRKPNETSANDYGDDGATPHFTACVALHIEHTHEYIHWERASWARTVLFFVYTSSILTLAQVRAFSALHSRPSSSLSMWLLSLLLDFLFLPLRFPRVPFLCPFFHLSDEQQPEKKIMENLCDTATNGGEGTYDVGYLPTGYEPKGHDFNELQNSSVSLSFKILVVDQDVGGWPDTRRDAHWSIPRTRRLLRTRRRVSQSVVFVCVR